MPWRTLQDGVWDADAVERLGAAAAFVLLMAEEGLPPAGMLALHPVAVSLHDAVLLVGAAATWPPHMPMGPAPWSADRHVSSGQAAAEHPELQNTVARFCELWWAQGLEGKEALVAQTLPFLLVRPWPPSPLATQPGVPC